MGIEIDHNLRLSIILSIVHHVKQATEITGKLSTSNKPCLARIYYLNDNRLNSSGHYFSQDLIIITKQTNCVEWLAFKWILLFLQEFRDLFRVEAQSVVCWCVVDMSVWATSNWRVDVVKHSLTGPGGGAGRQSTPGFGCTSVADWMMFGLYAIILSACLFHRCVEPQWPGKRMDQPVIQRFQNSTFPVPTCVILGKDRIFRLHWHVLWCTDILCLVHHCCYTQFFQNLIVWSSFSPYISTAHGQTFQMDSKKCVNFSLKYQLTIVSLCCLGSGRQDSFFSVPCLAACPYFIV